MLKLPPEPQGFHGDIVEDGFHGECIMGLDPIEEEERFLPWLQAVEHQERVLSRGRVGDSVDYGGEIGFVAVVQLLGEVPEVLDLGVV